MYKKSILFILLIPILFSVNNKTTKVNWKNPSELSQKSEKYYFVFIYAPWCNFCKKMKETTLNDTKIIDSLNKNFTCIAFNAQTQESIVYKDSSYQYNAQLSGGTHTLAYELGKKGGYISYPVLLILDKNLEIRYKFSGYLNNTSLAQILYLYNN